MQNEVKLKYLTIALYVIGVTYVVGVYLMMRWIWPSGWGWTPAQPEYENMILGVYAVLGIYLFRAAKDPMANVSLINFTIWSNVVHAAVMLYYSLIDDTEMANLMGGDIPALFLVAFVLWYLMPRGETA
ncbi:MAG: hypothetical protein OEY09_15340 [Gammaproteobacteria bacterium]|nr:hypothetical protein [Gammaproteobacteria bacterium]